MEQTVASYRDLQVWRAGLDLLDQLYALVEALPRSEQYVLQSQLLRAGMSVPLNIAEGCATGSTRTFMRHIAIARGSLAEVETCLEITKRRRYAHDQQITECTNAAGQIGRMLTSLNRSLGHKLTHQPPATNH